MASATTSIGLLEKMHRISRCPRGPAACPGLSIYWTPGPRRKHTFADGPGKSPHTRQSPRTHSPRKYEWPAAWISGCEPVESFLHGETARAHPVFRAQLGYSTDMDRAHLKHSQGKENHPPIPWQEAKTWVVREDNHYHWNTTICTSHIVSRWILLSSSQ